MLIYLILFVVTVAVVFFEHLLTHGGWLLPNLHILRVEHGVQLGHLVLTLPHNPMSAGIAQNWSRLLDIVLWLLAAPLAMIVGWHQALVWAGMMLGPLSLGMIVMALFWAVESFIFRRHAWLLLITTIIPVMNLPLAPAMLEGQVLPLMALLALMCGGVVRALRERVGFAFIAGIAGGFAVWLTPLALPFVALAYGGLVLRWFYAPNATCLLAMAAGIFDVLCLGFFVDPPLGGYGVEAFSRLSYVYVAMAGVLLASAACLPRLQRHLKTGRGFVGALVIAVPLCVWVLVFPGVMRAVLLPIGLTYSAALCFGVMGIVYAFLFVRKAYETKHYGEDQFLKLPAQALVAWLYLLFCTAATTLLSLYYGLFGLVASLLSVGLIFVVGSQIYASTLRRFNAGGTWQ